MAANAAVATIVIFILSIVFVVQKVKVPIGFGRHFTLDLLTGPIIAIAVLWASQCLGSSTIRDGILGTDGVKPYNILILFFSMAYMSVTLDVTGLLRAAAHWISNISGRSATKLYINFYIMVTVLSAILGNDAVILSGTPFLLYYTEATGLNSLPLLMTEFAAANTASMILFFRNPTNVVICEGFGIQDAAFTAYTILPFFACSVACLLVSFSQFRVSGHLHPQLPEIGKFDVRKDITDPVSAIVGSVLLGGCLITAIVVSFLHVDLWKITLPFAGAKLIFDIVWDLYKAHRKTRKGDEEQKFMAAQRELANSVVTSTMIANTRMAHPDVQQRLPKPLVPQLDEEKRADHMPLPTQNLPSDQVTLVNKPTSIDGIPPNADKSKASESGTIQQRFKEHLQNVSWWFETRQPTIYTAFPRLPFALVPFAFSQFILIEALARQGWIDIFARWLVIASGKRVFALVWIVGIVGIMLCNIAGTNIGATILLTKIVRAADLPPDSTRAAAVALALASNIGAVNFVFSASLAGLLWKQIIDTYNENRAHKIKITQRTFAKWNLVPLAAMAVIGLAVVSAEVAFLHDAGPLHTGVDIATFVEIFLDFQNMLLFLP